MNHILSCYRRTLARMVYAHSLRGVCAVFVWAAFSVPAQGQMPSGTPTPGLHTFARARGKDHNPPDRAGGKLKISFTQKKGDARLSLPGTRAMDPAIFGSPDKPSGFEPAPFPMLGIATDMRLEANGKYTIINHACPFSDWDEKSKGSVHMTVADITAIDGATTKDTIDFEANFELPDGAKYRIVCKKPLAHGGAFPFFGGVVTNHLIHGGAGIAPRALPTTFAYAAFWGAGDVYKDGSLINKGQLIHVWVDENIRGKGNRMRLDADAGNPSRGLTLHMVVPPYKPTPKGMMMSPLKTMFMPFPYVKPNIMREMKMAKKAGDQARLAEVMQIKTVMEHTKEHVVKETAAGKMYGMPFILMHFDQVKMKIRKLF